MNESEILIADFSLEEFVKVLAFPHPTQKSIMPVVAIKGDQVKLLGTCFAISNHGLVLTARHVLETVIDFGAQHNEWQVGAIYLSEPPADVDDVPDLFGGLLLANRLHTSKEFDIGVMHLNLMVRKDTGEPISMPAFRLSPGMPRNGATCLSVGYHDMKAEADGNQPYHYTIGRTYSASKGIIEEIHFPRLDNVLMPFPCFRTSMRHEPGMSGGPVLSEDGGVLGVICSAIHGQPIYYVSLIGLSLLLQVDAAKSDGSSGKVFLYDFVSGGAVGADATIDQLGIHRDGGTLQISFGIPPIFTGNLGI